MTDNIATARKLGTLIAVMQRIREIASTHTRVSPFENALDFAGMTSHTRMQQCLTNLLGACTERWLPMLENSGYDIDKLTQVWCIAVHECLAQVTTMQKMTSIEVLHYHQAVAHYRNNH